MDLTAVAAGLLDPIPANRTLGVRVLRAADGRARVGLHVQEPLTNVIGSLHASGLIALVDAAALAAIIAAADAPEQFADVVPLGAVARLDFLAPARGELVARCALDAAALAALTPLLQGETDRARLSTLSEVVDGQDVTVCRGQFDWRLRRTGHAPG